MSVDLTETRPSHWHQDFLPVLILILLDPPDPHHCHSSFHEYIPSTSFLLHAKSIALLHGLMLTSSLFSYHFPLPIGLLVIQILLLFLISSFSSPKLISFTASSSFSWASAFPPKYAGMMPRRALVGTIRSHSSCGQYRQSCAST